MATLPSFHIDLYDTEGAHFGSLHLSPKTEGALKGDAIFEITRGPDDLRTDDVRWMYKRRFTVVGEHKFVFSPDERLTVSQGAFSLELIPDLEEEGALLAKPGQPGIRGAWVME